MASCAKIRARARHLAGFAHQPRILPYASRVRASHGPSLIRGQRFCASKSGFAAQGKMNRRGLRAAENLKRFVSEQLLRKPFHNGVVQKAVERCKRPVVLFWLRWRRNLEFNLAICPIIRLASGVTLLLLFQLSLDQCPILSSPSNGASSTIATAS